MRLLYHYLKPLFIVQMGQADVAQHDDSSLKIGPTKDTQHFTPLGVLVAIGGL
jgi:hypothetical protein